MNGSRLREHRQPKVPFLAWAMLAAVVTALLILGPIATGCANEQAERALWQDCGVSHMECLHAEDFKSCEYEFYKECINE